MMRRMASIFWVTWFALCACQKGVDCDERPVYTYLSGSQNHVQAYQGGKFQQFRSQNDTLTFACSGPHQSFNKIQKVGEDINCGQDWYLQKLTFYLTALEDSSYGFEVSNRVSTEHAYSSVDIQINHALPIGSLDYALTRSDFFQDSVRVNGKLFKALTLFFSNGEFAGKWTSELGLAQIRFGKTDYTLME